MRLLIFDSHPVQYRVPVWQILESEHPGFLHVVYGSDCSVRGHVDEGFGKKMAWDEPMLSGYQHTVLNCEKGVPLSSWGSLTGNGVKELIDKIKPDAVLLVGLNYRYDLVAYIEARRRRIPVWLRCETQDYATHRSGVKSIVRSMIYRVAYTALSSSTINIFNSEITFIGNKIKYNANGASTVGSKIGKRLSKDKKN